VHHLDTLVLDHPTDVLDVRYGSGPSAARRVLRRTVVGAAAVLVVALVGWFTADAVGLTRTDSTAAADLPTGYLRADSDEPSPARAGHPRPTPSPEPPPAPDTGAPGRSTAELPVLAPAVRVPQPTSARPEVPSGKVGDTCTSPGAVGVTAKGKPVVCTAGGGPTRWKHA
jgi:hypothetical protein